MNPQSELQDLFTGAQYTIKHAKTPGAEAYVILFEGSRGEVGTGQANACKRCLNSGFNFIGVTSAYPDFYQSPEIEAVINTIVTTTQGFRRIGFGQSMGGFAVLNYFWALKLDHVVAFSPISTLHRDLIPWETRGPKLEAHLKARGVELNRVFLLQNPPFPSGIIAFDPSHPIDSRHAALIRKSHPNLVPIPMTFAGHLPYKALQETQLVGKWVPRFWSNTQNPTAFLRDWRARRSQAGYALHQAAKIAASRGRTKTAIALLQKAVALKQDFLEAQLDLATLLPPKPQETPASPAAPKFLEKTRSRLGALMRGTGR